MRITKVERMANLLNGLEKLGFNRQEAQQLRRIEMALHRWSEKECGDGNGCIERDEKTGRAFWLNANTGRRFPIPDREKGALKRLQAILAGRPNLWAYYQGDCRGCALYIGKKDGTTEKALDSLYTRGLAVCT